MAQVLKEEVRNRILEAAEKVFYKKICKHNPCPYRGDGTVFYSHDNVRKRSGIGCCDTKQLSR